MNTTHALRMALEALEFSEPEDKWLEYVCKVDEAITAIKEALAQPEQEKEQCVGCEACIDTACGRDECPKGWPKAAQPEQEPVALQMDVIVVNLVREGINKHRARELAEHFIKHTTPPQRPWVGLDDIDLAGCSNQDEVSSARYWEAKLKEKNT